jgi:hypothetical protein
MSIAFESDEVLYVDLCASRFARSTMVGRFRETHFAVIVLLTGFRFPLTLIHLRSPFTARGNPERTIGMSAFCPDEPESSSSTSCSAFLSAVVQRCALVKFLHLSDQKVCFVG